MIVSTVQISNAELWDLIILADVENASILPGQTPVITGIIVDHASNPIKTAQVHIHAGQESIFAVTDEQGQFKVELENFNKNPGTYVVNLVAKTPDGKTGIATTQFQVKGDFNSKSILEEKISTPTAKKYLEAGREQFSKDPIGLKLFNYYQEIYQQYLDEKKIAEQREQEQLFIKEQKALAEELRQEAIKEFNPTVGVFSGYKYDDYVNSLDPEIKDTIINQLEYTKNIFEDAQNIRDKILEDGGSQEEARQAYMDKILVSKKSLENFGIAIAEPEIIEKETIDETIDSQITNEEIPELESPDEEIVTQDDKQDTIKVNVDETTIEIGVDEKILSVNVNGTIMKLLVNATGIYQIGESNEQN